MLAEKQRVLLRKLSHGLIHWFQNQCSLVLLLHTQAPSCCGTGKRWCLHLFSLQQPTAGREGEGPGLMETHAHRQGGGDTLAEGE